MANVIGYLLTNAVSELLVSKDLLLKVCWKLGGRFVFEWRMACVRK